MNGEWLLATVTGDSIGDNESYCANKGEKSVKHIAMREINICTRLKMKNFVKNVVKIAHTTNCLYLEK